jgi:ABC-2 type transport system ATP-binding protein
MVVEDVLVLEGITKRYAAPALQDISLRLAPGESLALVGANGAGKSTLIKILLGLARPTSGTGTLFGFPFGDPRGLARTGYLPEMPSFWSELSAQDFLHSMARLRGLNPAASGSRIQELLGALGLKLRGARPMGGYSKGMLQRTGIAQALLHDPDFIVLDEPMSGLDPRAQEKLRLILQALRRRGKTLIISSHALEDIRSLCTRVVVLEKSRLVLDGPTESVLDELLRRYRSSEPWDDDPMTESLDVFDHPNPPPTP